MSTDFFGDYGSGYVGLAAAIPGAGKAMTRCRPFVARQTQLRAAFVSNIWR